MFNSLEIKAETAEMLAARARARGLSIDDYLRTLLPSTNGDDGGQPFYQAATPEEWVQAFRAWAAGHPELPDIVDDSRASIYQGRGE